MCLAALLEAASLFIRNIFHFQLFAFDEVLWVWLNVNVNTLGILQLIRIFQSKVPRKSAKPVLPISRFCRWICQIFQSR